MPCGTKYEWPSDDDKAKNLDATDPKKIEASLEAMVGRAVASAMAAQAEKNMKDQGIDKVDRKFLRFPELSGDQGFSTDLVRAKLGGQIEWSDGEASVRKRLLKGFFRHALFGTNFGVSCGQMDETLVRTLSTTDAAGGYLIPPGFIPEVTRDIARQTVLFNRVRRIPVVNDAGIMPKVSTNATVTWGSEGVAMTATGDPAFGVTNYAVNRMQAFVELTREIASDANPDIVQIVTELFQEAIAQERDKVIAIGSGTGKPLGIYSASGITNVSATTLTYANLVNLKESVDDRYHADPSFVWVFNQNVKAAIMRLVDSQGLPLFQTPRDGQPGLLLGVPYVVCNHCPNNFVFVGALRYYIWFDRQTLAVESTVTGGDSFKNHSTLIKFYERVDGKYVAPVTAPAARTRVLTGITALL